MNRRQAQLLGGVLLLLVGAVCQGANFYVDDDRPDDLGDGTNWATAKKFIQSAVNLAVSNETVWVRDGIYDTGGMTVGASALTNRVVVTNGIIVRSESGPTNALIVGAQLEGDIYGTGAVRCAYVSGGAWLIGFTLTNGATLNGTTELADNIGGGAYCDSGTLSNCWLVGNAARYGGGGIGVLSTKSGRAYNCILWTNQAGAIGTVYSWGGAAYYATLYSCMVSNNRSGFTDNYGNGGGTYGGSLYGCEVVSNRSAGGGGGVSHATLVADCTIRDNIAFNRGGGLRYCSTVTNCMIIDNKTTGGANEGGGACASTLRRCTVARNKGGRGGGLYFDNAAQAAYDCTIMSNTAVYSGGGVEAALGKDSTLYNCSVIANISGSQHGGGILRGTAYNTLVIGNQTSGNGGGANGAKLLNCTVAFNYSTSASGGGGVYDGVATNTIVYFNEATVGTNYAGTATFDYSCTFPQPPDGTGNTNAAPLFVQAGTGVGTNHVAGSYRLKAGSPGLDAAQTFSWMLPVDAQGRHRDLDGNPRINKNGSPDMGAYERTPEPGTVMVIR